MGYKESVMQTNPLSFWPLDDEISLGVAREATGKGSSGVYSGTIFNKAIPLVANGLYGTRLNSSDDGIYYPLPGAVGSGTSYEDAHVWSKGKDNQSFAIELFFKINNADTTVDSPLVIFGDSSPSVYGLYAHQNKIYFKPDPLKDTKVFFQVPDWNRRFHILANYNKNTISLIVNGIEIVTSSVESDFSFTQNPGGLKTIGSTYKMTIDAISIYGQNMSQAKALDHCFMSRKTAVKKNHLNRNAQVYYMPNNDECLFGFKFYNSWSTFNFNNIVVNSGNQLTLRTIPDQVISGTGTHSFSTVSGRQALTLGSAQYLDLSSLIRLTEKGSAISVSFFHGASNFGGIVSLQNTAVGQGVGCYTTATKFNIVHSGSTTELPITGGWHEVIIENTSEKVAVYLDGTNVYTNVNSLSIIDECYVGVVGNSYTTSPISWVAVESEIQISPITDHLLYNELTDFTLKLNGNLKWSQRGVAKGFLYVPQGDYDGSLAFYTASSENVSITYNNGSVWPREGILPGLIESDASQVNFYEIQIVLTTEDSINDLPILFDLGLSVYSNAMKRVIPENASDPATIFNKDASIIYNDDIEILDRLDRAGIRLGGNSYLSIPSQSKNSDASGFNGTKSISMVFKINQSLVADTYVLKSGTKALYWDGTEWQYPGFNNIYVNGKPGIINDQMVDDWVHVTLTSSSKINAGDAIYVGADNTGAKQMDITLGLFTMAAYVFDAGDVEVEYETLVGFPEEVVAVDTLSFNVIDYGLQAYNYSFQTA
jgi:hypothetical protein